MEYDELDDVEDYLIEEIIGYAIGECGKHLDKRPCRDSILSGDAYINEVLMGHEDRCHQMFRMNKHVFMKFCDLLQGRGLLQNTCNVTIKEQVAMFLYAMGHKATNRVNQERFQHSEETISRHFHKVLNAVISLSSEFIHPPHYTTPLEILNDERFFPFFKDCIGAIDGTHILAIIPAHKQPSFCNRKGDISQNVLMACTFDMQFSYVYAGWEGSAADSYVLRATMENPDAKFPYPPEGKYYVVDARYSNTKGFLAPYRGVRYHLHEYKDKNQQPKNAQELYNYRHSSLRNVVERCFGVLTARFPILKGAPYAFEVQRDIVMAACILHNYIRIENRNDWLFEKYEDILIVEEPDEDDLVEVVASLSSAHTRKRHQRQAKILRDSIARDLWNAYN